MVRAKLAGTWYEAEPAMLRAELESWLSASTEEPRADVLALILPHAGYRYSGPTAARGLALVRGQGYSRVIVIGPSHRLPLRNRIALPEGTAFTTPLGSIPFDESVFERLLESPLFATLEQAHHDEHSIEIQLPMLQAALGDFTLVPLVVGDLDPAAIREAAALLRSVVDDDTLVVASSDFTHYGWRFGYEPFRTDVLARIEELDMGAFASVERIDADAFAAYIEETGATVCGRRPIEILLRMLPSDARARLLAYETSGRLTQDQEHSVSYLAAVFEGAWSKAGMEEGEILLRLARAAIRSWLETGKTPTPESLGIELPASLGRRSGAFVTLRREGELRGCVGHIRATDSLGATLVQCAVGAAAHDRRFSPVTADELDALTIAVSVLTEPHPVEGADAIRLGRDGIILEAEGRTAVFLPEVPTDLGWNLETTLANLCEKAQLPRDAWRGDATLQVFQAIKYVESG